jgi:hypothetical protein
MTKADVERLAAAVPREERRRIWFEVCPSPHNHEKLLKTDDGFKFCPNCCSLWDGQRLLNEPR